MLTIIHGDDTASSRKHFLDEKQKRPNALLLDGEKVTLTDLIQIFEGGGLFVETQEVFMEQFVTKRKKSTEFKQLVAYLEKQSTEHSIFMWEAKELEKGTLMAFRSALARPFKLPQTLFTLMDSIKPNNGPTLVSLFHKTLENADVEMVFYMMIRQVRIILALSDSSTEEIDELKRMTWQRSKLENQARLFEKEKLIDIYQKLFVLEKGMKTGSLSVSLTSAIDFLLIEI